MKKLLFFTVFSFLFSTIMSGQDTNSTQTNNDKKDFTFGSKAGINLASVSDINEGVGESINSRTSFHVGALGEYSFSENFSVQAELLYSELGYEYEYRDDDFYPYLIIGDGGGGYSYYEEGVIKLAYLSMPVLAKYYIISGLSVEAGPQFSILLSAKNDWEYTDEFNEESGSDDIDIKDQINSVDVGVAMGTTYELALGIFFSIRYVLGLTDIFDYVSAPNSRNNVFQASAGFKFK